MKTHFDHLLDVIPDLRNRNILDLGSGRGSFLIQCAKNGASAEGLELNKEYIEKSLFKAKEEGVSIKVLQGVGESLPFVDGLFDFVNLCEVIEHVNSPTKVMKEVFRVLKSGGMVYISVPNRFGVKDQHFNLYFVNWLPRSISDLFISVFGKHKVYNNSAGLQRLSEMHYYTYPQAKIFFESTGFIVHDIREIKINKKFKNKIIKFPITCFYRFLRFFYFDSFHFLLKKN